MLSACHFARPAASVWLWGLALLVTGLHPGTASAQPSVATPPPHRFLFVVETSRAMQGRLSGMETVAKDLLDSRFKGQLHAGDLVGVWVFGQETRTNVVPFQELSPVVAVAILNSVLGTSSDKRADSGRALPLLVRALLDTPELTLILLSSGDAQITGTPFDTAINGAWKQWRDSQQKAGQPLVTLLRSQGGKITDWAFAPAPWPVELPAPRPERSPKPPGTNTLASDPPIPLAKATNAPQPRAVVEQAPNGTPLATSPPAPLIITSPRSNPPPAAPQARTTAETNAAPIKPETLTIPIRPPSIPQKPATAKTETNPPPSISKPVTPAPPAVSIPTNAPPNVESTPAAPESAPLAKPSGTPPATSPPPPIVITSPPSNAPPAPPQANTTVETNAGPSKPQTPTVQNRPPSVPQKPATARTETNPPAPTVSAPANPEVAAKPESLSLPPPIPAPVPPSSVQSPPPSPAISAPGTSAGPQVLANLPQPRAGLGSKAWLLISFLAVLILVVAFCFWMWLVTFKRPESPRAVLSFHSQPPKPTGTTPNDRSESEKPKQG